MANDTSFRSIYIWSAGDGQLRKVTDELFNAGNPAWDPQGNYLYYLSDREYAPQISSIEFNYALNRSTGIFALALRRDVKSPFPPESDEVTVTKDDSDPPKEPEKKEPAPKPGADLAIDFDGLGSRVARVPLEANNYGGLAVKNGHLFTGSGLRSTTDGKASGRSRCAFTRSRSAKRPRSPKTSADSRFRTTARRCWSRVGRGASASTKPRPRGNGPRSRFRPLDSPLTACPPKSGTRFSTRYGGAIATFSTCQHARLRLGGLARAVSVRSSSTSHTVRT